MKLPTLTTVNKKRAGAVVVALVIIIVLFMLFSGDAQAWGTTNNTTNTTNNYHDQSSGNSGNNDYKKATAAAFAMAGAQFDYAKGWQGSVSAGYWDGESAIGAQLGKRVDDILISGGGACDTDFDNCGGVIGASWHF